MNYEAIAKQTPKFASIFHAIPGCVIAGGYIRDLLLDKPTRDIDIFVDRTPTAKEIQAVEKPLGTTFFEFTLEESDDEEYQPEGGRTSDIQTVFKTLDVGVDIIVVDSVLTHIEEFPDNISKVYVSEKAGLVMLPEFVEGHTNKHITYRTSSSPGRLEKLQAKFPDYLTIYWSKE